MIGIFASANIPCELDAVDEGARQFEETARQNMAWQQAFQVHHTAEQTVLKLQEGLARSKAQLAGLESQLAGMQKKTPRLKSLQAKESAQEYQRTIETLEAEYQNNRSQIVRLRDTTQKEQNQLSHLAELDEDIGLAKAEVARLEFFRSSLELARDALQIAAKDFQKQFAPRLEMEMRPALKRITQAHYEDIRVSPDTLDVEVFSPEKKKFISTGVLSAGTRDLIYLTLRVGLARLMSNSGEKLPLLLDDPLVQYDSQRKHEALDYLISLAETTQVFLFSADSRIKDALFANKGKSIHQVIELD
jgi:DNA sulfur modification protein DndD